MNLIKKDEQTLQSVLANKKEIILLFLNNKMLSFVLLSQNNKNASSKTMLLQSVLLFQNNKDAHSKTTFSQHQLQAEKIEDVRLSSQK